MKQIGLSIFTEEDLAGLVSGGNAIFNQTFQAKLSREQLQSMQPINSSMENRLRFIQMKYADLAWYGGAAGAGAGTLAIKASPPPKPAKPPKPPRPSRPNSMTNMEMVPTAIAVPIPALPAFVETKEMETDPFAASVAAAFDPFGVCSSSDGFDSFGAEFDAFPIVGTGAATKEPTRPPSCRPAAPPPPPLAPAPAPAPTPMVSVLPEEAVPAYNPDYSDPQPLPPSPAQTPAVVVHPDAIAAAGGWLTVDMLPTDIAKMMVAYGLPDLRCLAFATDDVLAVICDGASDNMRDLLITAVHSIRDCAQACQQMDVDVFEVTVMDADVDSLDNIIVIITDSSDPAEAQQAAFVPVPPSPPAPSVVLPMDPDTLSSPSTLVMEDAEEAEMNAASPLEGIDPGLQMLVQTAGPETAPSRDIMVATTDRNIPSPVEVEVAAVAAVVVIAAVPVAVEPEAQPRTLSFSGFLPVAPIAEALPAAPTALCPPSPVSLAVPQASSPIQHTGPPIVPVKKYTKQQACGLTIEMLREDGFRVADDCLLCLDDGIYCRVGNHKSMYSNSQHDLSEVYDYGRETKAVERNPITL